MAALDGRVALVTGGASGIGLATVGRLKAEGARVAAVDLAEPRGDDPSDLHVVADVGDPAAWPGIVQRVEQQLGPLDVAYLNAGVLTGEHDIAELTDEQYRRIMRVNVDGVVFGVREAVRAMRPRGSGQIVATASLAGIVAFDHDPIYTASKHAVVGLVRSLGTQLNAAGIHIAAVCPGIVETPLIGDDATVLRDAGFPMLRAEDIADAVLLALRERRPGACYAVQPGREPVEFRFPNVPGPRTPGAEGVRPPL
ncbi:MAG TPA: SDR family oxidoreductase [Candidatus Angelobacter sp.]|jgi:NAD(P)-dependent dehydrogenase (short-subunit alcohol dehydrogenase family)|nr:SDR family oxidoreductase [Candidatus Angelobacter sp.]